MSRGGVETHWHSRKPCSLAPRKPSWGRQGTVPHLCSIPTGFVSFIPTAIFFFRDRCMVPLFPHHPAHRWKNSSGLLVRSQVRTHYPERDLDSFTCHLPISSVPPPAPPPVLATGDLRAAPGDSPAMVSGGRHVARLCCGRQQPLIPLCSQTSLPGTELAHPLASRARLARVQLVLLPLPSRCCRVAVWAFLAPVSPLGAQPLGPAVCSPQAEA